MMDVDEQPSTSQATSKKQNIFPVDEAHPFDVESYIGNYTGRTAIDRLCHIIITCPSIAPEALNLAVQHIHQSREPALFQLVLNAYDHACLSTELPSSSDLPGLDSNWTEETLEKNQSDRVKLESELKTYSNSMIKESIRMGHRELGQYYRSIGDHPTALKHYTKSREFCTTSQHVLDMCMSVLELLIEQKNYSHIPTYVFKAEAALDAAQAASAAPAASNGTGGVVAPTPTANKKVSAEREKVQSKLDFAAGLSNLGLGNYEKSAQSFLRLGPSKELGDWIGQLVAPGDIAIYATLCALATYSRPSIRAQITENQVFGIYIEQEPYVRELLEAFMGSNFKSVLELLVRYSTRHAADIHLTPHIPALTTLIRNSAVVLYFQPFATIKLERMSRAFGWTVDEVEHRVVALIQSGDIKGRVDSQNKILQARKTDYRAELFAHAIKAGTDMHSANKKLLLRMRLQGADLVIKAPKGQQGTLHEFVME